MRANSSRFPLRRLAVACLLVVTLGFGIGFGVARAADQALDDALNALQKAAALVESSVAGVADPKIVHRFERRRERALRKIDDAMQAIEAAKQAVDG